MMKKSIQIPQWLSEVKKTLSSSLKYNKKFIKTFDNSTAFCRNPEKIKAPFLIFVLKSTLDKFDHTKYPDVKKVVDTVIDLYETGETDKKKFEAAAYAARAAWAAAYAANATAWAAVGAASAAANAAAEAAARASAYAATAETAEAAAWAAEGAAAEYGARTADDAAAKQQEYEKFADKLLDLMKEQEYTPAQKKIAKLLNLI